MAFVDIKHFGYALLTLLLIGLALLYTAKLFLFRILLSIQVHVYPIHIVLIRNHIVGIDGTNLNSYCKEEQFIFDMCDSINIMPHYNLNK